VKTDPELLLLHRDLWSAWAQWNGLTWCGHGSSKSASLFRTQISPRAITRFRLLIWISAAAVDCNQGCFRGKRSSRVCTRKVENERVTLSRNLTPGDGGWLLAGDGDAERRNEKRGTVLSRASSWRIVRSRNEPDGV